MGNGQSNAENFAMQLQNENFAMQLQNRNILNQNSQMERILAQMSRTNANNQQLVSQIMSLEKELRTLKMMYNNNPVNKQNRMTKQDLANARKAWGDALVKISTVNDEYGLKAATQVANQVLDAAYGYNLGPVLFKPTLTSGVHTFRPTREGALAYFVGQNSNFPDEGFALKNWREADIQTVAEFVDGDVGMWMGNVTLTDKYGRKTTVDKSWGYKKDENGDVRIVLHHSSLPHRPNRG